MAKTQFNRKVKVVRYDNTVELDDKHCRPIFGELGIVHQTSYVDTLEQNGRVKRRHRNLLEMARALKLQVGVPTQFWWDIVLAATHITSRRPTTILENVSPYEVLYKTKPNYNLLKTFGCFVIVYYPDKSGNKLNVRGALHFLRISILTKRLQSVQPTEQHHICYQTHQILWAPIPIPSVQTIC